jgi:hypothetical protein
MSNAERFYFFSYSSGKEVCGRRRADEKLFTTSPLPMQKGETFFSRKMKYLNLISCGEE